MALYCRSDFGTAWHHVRSCQPLPEAALSGNWGRATGVLGFAFATRRIEAQFELGYPCSSSAHKYTAQETPPAPSANERPFEGRHAPERERRAWHEVPEGADVCRLTGACQPCRLV